MQNHILHGHHVTMVIIISYFLILITFSTTLVGIASARPCVIINEVPQCPTVSTTILYHTPPSISFLPSQSISAGSYITVNAICMASDSCELYLPSLYGTSALCTGTGSCTFSGPFYNPGEYAFNAVDINEGTNTIGILTVTPAPIITVSTSGCLQIGESNAVYILTTNIICDKSSGTDSVSFAPGTSNTTLNCNGHWIANNYASSSYVYGVVNLSSNNDDDVIKNCAIYVNGYRGNSFPVQSTSPIGISIGSSHGDVLDNVGVFYAAQYNILVDNAYNVTIENATLGYAQAVGIDLQYANAVTIQNSSFSNIKWAGIADGIVAGPGEPLNLNVHNNKYVNNKLFDMGHYGIQVVGPNELVANNTCSFSHDNCILLVGPEYNGQFAGNNIVENNTVSGAINAGIEVFESNNLITGNKVFGNSYGSYITAGCAYDTVQYNNFSSNLYDYWYNICAEPPEPAKAVCSPASFGPIQNNTFGAVLLNSTPKQFALGDNGNGVTWASQCNPSQIGSIITNVYTPGGSLHSIQVLNITNGNPATAVIMIDNCTLPNLSDAQHASCLGITASILNVSADTSIVIVNLTSP